MKIKDWMKRNKNDEVRKQLFEEAGTTMGYIQQLMYTDKQASPDFCKALYLASVKVTPATPILPKDERPDIAEIFQLGVKVFPPEDKRAA
ncbi:MAG: hypothetical protein CMB80_08755 [Flammeovirgaceae bacterium]|nr:hypothetical protein [Flammeovirgaceae bacterium]|tara:strand:- start:1146 stop:1415 length:270 start_codon:yes stop_codon:yes gene_type:complete